MQSSEITFTVEESPQGGYEARAIGHGIHTHADSKEELRAMVRDAVRCHFDPADVPATIRLRFVQDEVIRA
jgi:hypothetical protein